MEFRLECMFVTILACLVTSHSENSSSFQTLLADCENETDNFDDCLKDALNTARSWYWKGDPALGIPPMDPMVYFGESHSVVKTQWFTIDGSITDVVEYGWANSTYTGVKTFENKVNIYQQIPNKVVAGLAKVNITLFGVNLGLRTTNFTLTIRDVKERLTIQYSPKADVMKVNLIVLDSKSLEVQFENLIYDKLFQRALHAMVNNNWRFWFLYFRQGVYDLSDQLKTITANKIYYSSSIKSLLKSHLRRNRNT